MGSTDIVHGTQTTGCEVGEQKRSNLMRMTQVDYDSLSICPFFRDGLVLSGYTYL